MGDKVSESEVQETIVAGGLTQIQIDDLKRKSKCEKLTLITIDGDKHFWLKEPDMNTVKATAKLGDDVDPITGMQTYFRNCLVLGDESASEDVATFMALMPHLQSLTKEYTAEVKNF